MFKILACPMLATLFCMCCCDEKLSHWNWFHSLFSDSPKPWMIYAMKRLQMVTAYIPHRCNVSHLVNYLDFLNKWSLFTYLQRNHLEHHLNDSYVSRLGHQEFHIQMLILKPLGRMNLNTDVTDIPHVITQPEYSYLLRSIQISIVWSFELQHQLSINCFVHEIFIRKVFSSCLRANLSFLNHQRRLRGNPQKFQFCGRLAPFVIYLGKIVDIQLKYFLAQKAAKFVLNYSTIASHIIKSEKPSTIYPFFETTSVDVKNYSLMLHTYHIEIHKHKQLCLNFTNPEPENTIIFDGPGYHRRLRWPSVAFSTVCVSTFQCLVQIMKTSKQEPGVIMYATKDVFVKNMIVGPKHSVTLAFPEAISTKVFDQFSVLKLSANQTLNLTMKRLSFRGTVTSSCRYGGVAFHTMQRKQFPLYPTLCTNESGSEWFRSKYISTGEVYVVVYSYYEYSNISAHLMISTTHCKPVSLDVCSFLFYCVDRQQTKIGSRECNMFFHKLNNESDIQFLARTGFEENERWVWNPYLIYHPHPNSCVVLQMGNGFVEKDEAILYKDNEGCAIPSGNKRQMKHVILIPALQIQNALTYHVRLAGQIHSRTDAVEKLNLVLPKEVSLKFAINIFPLRKTGWQELHDFVHGSEHTSKFSTWETKRWNNEGTVHFSLSFRTPVLSTVPKVTLHTLYYKSSLSWMDIQISCWQADTHDMQYQVLHAHAAKNRLSTSLVKHHVLGIALSLRDRLKCFLRRKKNKLSLVTFNATLKSKPAVLFDAEQDSPAASHKIHGKLNTEGNISCFKQHYFISMTGLASSVLVNIQATNITEDVVSYWAGKNSEYVSMFSSASAEKPVKPALLDSLPVIRQHFKNGIYNIFPINLGSHMALLDYFVVSVELSYEEDSFHSWLTVSKSCNKISAHLPVFLEEADAEEFITFLKVRDDLPWMGAVYIGLKVRYLLCSVCVPLSHCDIFTGCTAYLINRKKYAESLSSTD